MDIVTMILIEDGLNIPLDIIRYINLTFYSEINNSNFRSVIKMWFEDNERCKFMYGPISQWRTGKVTDMSYAFYRKENFNEDISGWNVSNVVNMNDMFYGCKNFNCDLSKWNVSKLQYLTSGFKFCSSFDCDLSGWNISNVKSMHVAFYGCEKFNCPETWNRHVIF